MTPELQCRLCPALVATAGGDLALLEEHLHSLHRVAGTGHLQLYCTVLYCTVLYCTDPPAGVPAAVAEQGVQL